MNKRLMLGIVGGAGMFVVGSLLVSVWWGLRALLFTSAALVFRYPISFIGSVLLLGLRLVLALGIIFPYSYNALKQAFNLKE